MADINVLSLTPTASQDGDMAVAVRDGAVVGVSIRPAGTVPPTTGTHEVGEIVWNSAPAINGFVGWVCIASGSPGAWAGFGLISSSFSLDILYASGAAGIWLDQSDLTTDFQDSAGTTQVTTLEEPVGMRSDKSGRGLHMRQATSGNRPTFSARVNLVPDSEAIHNFPVAADGAVALAPGKTAPNGGTVTKLTTTTGAAGYAYIADLAIPAGTNRFSIYAEMAEASTLSLTRGSFPDPKGEFNLANGTVISVSGGATATIEALSGAWAGWYRCEVAFEEATATTRYFYIGVTGSAGQGLYVAEVQVHHGAAAAYQRIDSATEYATAGFPYYDKFDAAADSYGTGAFAAGTLTNNMDCFVAIKRTDASKFVLFHQLDGGAAKLAAAESGSSTAAAESCGSPTFFVNGIPVQGGTGTTRGQLHDQMPVGEWAVLEIQNADLSAWTAFNVGGYTTGSYGLFGQIAGLVLCPAQSDANRTMIRQHLADKVGATLPDLERPSVIDPSWTNLYSRDYSTLNAISLNFAQSDAGITSDKGELKIGTLRYRDYLKCGLHGYGFDVFPDPHTSDIPAEYKKARPLGEVEPIPGVGIRLHARGSTGAAMTARAAADFPDKASQCSSAGTQIHMSGHLASYSKIACKPPFARVTYYIPRHTAAHKAFTAALWSVEDGNKAWPNDTLHAPFEYDDHEFLGFGTDGIGASVNIHAYGPAPDHTPVMNSGLGTYNAGDMVGQKMGVCTVFTTTDIKTYMNKNDGAWTLVSTVTTAALAGAEWDQAHIAFIHNIAAGFPWDGASGVPSQPLAVDIVKTQLFGPGTTGWTLPADSPPAEVTVTPRSGFTGTWPAGTPSGTTVADLTLSEGVVSANVIVYNSALVVVGTELRVGSAALTTDMNPMVFHIEGVKASGAKSVGRRYAHTIV